MSYEGIFIETSGVTLDIPLSDYSTILMTLHLLYDCYIQLSTLDLHLTRHYITMHVCPCGTKWPKNVVQYITETLSIVVRPTRRHACDGESGEIMPILVIRDGVHA